MKSARERILCSNTKPPRVYGLSAPDKSGQPVAAETMDIAAIARRSSARAVAVLAEIMDDKDAPASSRVAAALAILDRAHGRPTQSVETRHTDMTTLHLRALEAHLAAAKPPELRDVTPPATLPGTEWGTGDA